MSETVARPQIIPSPQNSLNKSGSAPDQQLGMLDLSVQLSARDITAGHEFTLFVLVRNPLPVPIWISRVHLSLPSELTLPSKKGIENELKGTIESKIKEIDGDRKYYKATISQIEKHFAALKKPDRSREEQNADVQVIREDLDSIKDRLGSPKAQAGFSLFGMTFSTSSDITSEQASTLRELPTEREIDLESSLPKGSSLFPSSTAVYTVALNVIRPTFKPPSQFRLQISVVYSLRGAESKDKFANTIAHEISIRPAIETILAGSAVGGAVGCVARYLQKGSVDWSNIGSLVVSLLLSVLLSAVAIIFTARKTDTQPFVSVEDFWGGLLIGFFVGYTGTSFFQDLTKMS